MEYQIDEKEIEKQFLNYVEKHLNNLFGNLKKLCSYKCRLLKVNENDDSILDTMKDDDSKIDDMIEEIICLMNKFIMVLDVEKMVNILNELVFFMRLVVIHFETHQEYLLGDHAFMFGKDFDFNAPDNFESIATTINESLEYLKFIPIDVLMDKEFTSALVERCPEVYTLLPIEISLDSLVIEKYLKVYPQNKEFIIERLRYHLNDEEVLKKILKDLGIVRKKSPDKIEN